MNYLNYRAQTDAQSYKPQFFRIYNATDAEYFNLAVSDPDLVIHDTIQHQLAELIRMRNPSIPVPKEELNERIQAHLGNLGLHEYGVWVLFPWSKQMVHILDEQEFIEVRTSRNMYKISPDEQMSLRSKSVGIVGLSVGSAIAYTMAMERSFGAVVLADFDHIDLSNLNRIRASLADLGMNKAVVMAREIAELDPFIQVDVMEDGISDDNMAAFLQKYGGLDLIIDECDSLEVKIALRKAAKQAGIPLVMETSDRGMLDIERFDLEPDRPLFHGRLAGFPLEGLDKLGPAERAQYLMAVVGINEVSERLRYSYSEIGKTITTWPQLASAVVMGGGTTADVARRILLKEPVGSGRFYVDMQSLVPNTTQIDGQ